MDSTAIIALVISIVSFLLTSFFAFSKYFSQKLDDRIKKIELREKYFDEIIEWSNSVIEVIQKSSHFILIKPNGENSEELFSQKQNFRIECSILIDKGRWVFPNIEEDDNNRLNGYGKDVINCVVWTYKFISSIDVNQQENNWEIRENLIETKREFINQIRTIINPEHRDEEYKKIIGG